MKRVRITTPFPSVSATAKAFGISQRRQRELRALAAKLMNRGNGNTRVLASKKKKRPRTAAAHR